MCTTPAPPDTAFVAARIWSGTGEVNTSPATAASSMPTPTKPSCSGSCPEPPPETRPTLPCTGASPRTTIRWSTSTRSSGWAAASPRSASLTTSAGALMSFFTGAPLGARLGQRKSIIVRHGRTVFPHNLSAASLLSRALAGAVAHRRPHRHRAHLAIVHLDVSWCWRVFLAEGRARAVPSVTAELRAGEPPGEALSVGLRQRGPAPGPVRGRLPDLRDRALVRRPGEGLWPTAA